MKITIKAFLGMMPRIEPHLLQTGNAQLAVDAKLWSGSVDNFKMPQLIMSLAKVGAIQSIYRFGKKTDSDTEHWFHFINDTDVARGAIPDDSQERTYFTEAGQPPKVTDATMATSTAQMPSNAYLLGIPAPADRATVVVTPDAADPDGTLERQSCLLAYTYVSGWGEEGPPSLVSEPFDATTGDTLAISNLTGTPSGAYNITHKRLYMSVTDSTGTAVLRYLTEIPISEGTVSFVLDITVLGETLPENSLVPPPEDLFGIMSHPAGFMVGFSGQRVYCSEVYKPYGWPYYFPVADDIVGGAILGQSTVICTKGSTYLSTQADPINFTPIQLDGWQPCVSKRSICKLQGGVMYASPDGLVSVDQSNGIRVITAQLITRDEWQAYKPESMMCVTHDGRLFVFYDTGTKKGGLIFEFASEGVTLIETTVHATAAFADERRDALFLVVEAGKLHKWDAGTASLPHSWTSKVFIADRPQNIGAAQVVADGYPVTLQLTGKYNTSSDAQDVTQTIQVQNSRPFRLSGGYRMREYQFTVSGSHAVREVILAGTLAEITQQA